MLNSAVFAFLLAALCQAKHDEIIAQCKAEFGITDAMKPLQSTGLTEPMKCFIRCANDKLGYLTPDGKLLLEKVKADEEFPYKSPEMFACLEKFQGFRGCEGAEEIAKCHEHH